MTALTAIFLLTATVVAIKLAKGYRPDIKNGGLKATGLLLANSIPEGAQVFINGQLKTATDDTLNLPPGEYQVEIKKIGYHPWQKKLKIQAELVTETNAKLFPAVPELKPLTFAGAQKPFLSPDKNTIFFENQTGFWFLEMNTRLLSNPRPKKISQAEIKAIIKKQELEKKAEEIRQLNKFPLEFRQVATSSAQIISFSPDETKVLYLAKENFQIPQNLISPVPAASTQPEERELKANVLYVYDRKEDRNFRIHESLENIVWFTDSRHLVFIEGNKIKVVEYDGQNETILYAGKLKENFFALWPDGSRLVILTNLNPESTSISNLYAINLR